VSAQAAATEKLGQSMLQAGVRPAPAVRVLPTEYGAGELPEQVDGQPVLGLDGITLGVVPFDPTGTMVVAGPPGSGRSNALVAISRAVRRANPEARLYLFAQGRSAIADKLPWTEVATGIDKVKALATDLLAAVQDPDVDPGIVVVIEGLNEYLQSPADKPIQDLTKAIR